MYTKGEWKASDVLHSGGTICIRIGDDTCKWGVGEFVKVLPNNSTDSDVEETHVSNSHLICSAVNACQSVNHDNPLAVAEAIKPMYEALKHIMYRIDSGLALGEKLDLEQARQALAKVEE